MDLHDFFREAVARQLSRLEELVDRVETDEGAEFEARRLAHNLKGSGATYGFPEVTERATGAVDAPTETFGTRLHDLIRALSAVSRSPEPFHILVIDDDELITRLLGVRLAGPDRVVTAAGSVREATEALTRSTPDVVVLDLILPDGDGRDLLDQLTLTSPSTGVIVTTATKSDELRMTCTAAGAVGFLNKPLDLDALVALVTRTLVRRREGTEDRDPLLERYDLLNASGPVAVAAVVPELHGPGGLGARSETPIVEVVMATLGEILGNQVAIGRWSDTELVAFAGGEPHDLRALLDWARMRLRNARPHPDGAVLSVSVGVCPGVGDLRIGFEMARRTAAVAMRAGGDRVLEGPVEHNPAAVLVAEDDPLTAALIIHRLEKNDLRVTHCADGLQALEVARAEQFDLVILDIQMPGLDGFGVLAALRADERYATTPIVILTSVGSERDVVRGFDLGCDDYVLKPFSPAELAARLRRFTRT